MVVSFPLRVSPLCELARGYLADGAVGEPVHVSAVNYVPYGTVYWEQPYRDYDITGGLVGRDRWDDGILRPSTWLVDPSRGSVLRSHSEVMQGPCRPTGLWASPAGEQDPAAAMGKGNGTRPEHRQHGERAGVRRDINLCHYTRATEC